MKYLVILALLVGACASDSSSPKAGSAATYTCAHLAKLGCTVASTDQAMCATVLEHVTDSHLTAIDTKCLDAATTKAAVVACGGVDCP